MFHLPPSRFFAFHFPFGLAFFLLEFAHAPEMKMTFFTPSFSPLSPSLSGSLAHSQFEFTLSSDSPPLGLSIPYIVYT